MLTPEERLAHLELRLSELEELVPKTSLLSKEFLARAFTVWGHCFVAASIIGIPLLLISIVFWSASGP